MTTLPTTGIYVLMLAFLAISAIPGFIAMGDAYRQIGHGGLSLDVPWDDEPDF